MTKIDDVGRAARWRQAGSQNHLESPTSIAAHSAIRKDQGEGEGEYSVVVAERTRRTAERQHSVHRL